MALPKRPTLNVPIPNYKVGGSDQSQIKGPYWYMNVGDGLEVDGQGSLQIAGSEPSDPSAYLYGPNGLVGVGTGLELSPEGELKTSEE